MYWQKAYLSNKYQFPKKMYNMKKNFDINIEINKTYNNVEKWNKMAQNGGFVFF